MNKLRLGVIGAGGIAYRRTIPEVARDVDNCVITSVMDINAETASKVADEFHVPHCCATEAELIARDDADAVAGKAPPEVPIEDGIHSVRLVQAIYRSARERRAIRLDEIEG